ncbi:MAG: methyltransferase domain-containing protein [Candidatus Dormibacteraeota bacterium]|nr:methyltransferase domain-containing protein [Candidatus Dormibacteraeota bacterium]
MTTPATHAVSQPPAVTDVQRLAVYRWIAPLASGRRLLDVGCASAEGAALLAESGAREVLALDLDGQPSSAGRPRGAASGVTVERGDPRRLPHPDASFQLVVAIGLGSLPRDDVVLDELCRVTAADGQLLVSAVDGDPAAELRARLLSRFGNVITARQSRLIGSVIVQHGGSEDGGGHALTTLVRHADQPRPVAGDQVFLLAGHLVAEVAPVVVLEDAMASHRWVQSWREQRAMIDALRNRVLDLEQRVSETEQLRGRLAAAQWALGTRLATQEWAVLETAAETAALYEATVGWKLTAPVRRAGRLGSRVLRRR